MSDYLYPQPSVTASNPSVGTTNTTAPTSATEVAGVNPSGNLQPFGTDASGNLLVSVASSLPLPSGAATAANQATEISSLATIATNTTGAATSALQTTGNTSLATIATNTTGVATAANQTTEISKLTAISAQLPTTLGAKTTANSLAVNIASDQIINTSDAANGSATGGTAGTKSELGGGIYNSTLPTLTTGQQAALQLDASGRQIVSQGGPGTVANAWYTKTTDGTNTAAVKAASTAPAATDPALVVTISPNSTATSTKSPVNTNGSQSTNASVSTTSVGFTPPTNAVGFILEAESGNSTNMRWAIVTTPTTTSGMLMEPGRDTGFIPCAAQVNVISVSGTNAVGIQWVMSS